MDDAHPQMVFINRRSTDLGRSRAFYAALGFGFDERFCGADGIMVTVSPAIHLMLLTPARFAELANVRVKISGLGVAGQPWRAEDNRGIVLDTIAIFGAPRCMFASNFPVDSLCGSLDTIFAGFKAITAELPAADQARLFRDTAREVYRTGAPS